MILNEYESKKLLSSYDIPVTRESIVRDENHAIICAYRLGYPVVLKIHSSKILHKAKLGGVLLNNYNSDILIKNFQILQEKFKDETKKGVLIQKQIKLKQELILGYKNDFLFGPLIMFGLGGVRVEEERHITFRSLPIREYEVEDMVKKFIDSPSTTFMNQLISIIYNIDNLVLNNPTIKEIDINPLGVDKKERLVVIDALILC